MQQPDIWQVIGKLLDLAASDPSVLPWLLFILIGIYAVLSKVAQIPGAVSAWRKRRKGEGAVDPHLETQRLLAKSLDRVTAQDEKLTGVVEQLSQNQARNVETSATIVATTKQLSDRNTLLEDLVKQSNDAINRLTAAIERNSDLSASNAQVLNGAMREMRGAQGVIIAEVKGHIDQSVSGISAMLNGVGATVSGSADKLTTVEQKAQVHSTMTEEAFNKILARLENLPTKDELKGMLTDMQAEVTKLEEQNTALKAANALLTEENETLKKPKVEPVVPAAKEPAV